MVLPIWMLKGMQMKPKQKYGLIALFSMAIIIMIFEVVRTVCTIRLYSGSNKNVYVSLIFTVMEVNLAVIISALMVYRALFIARRKRNTGYRSLPHPTPIRHYPTTDESVNTGNEHELHNPTTSNKSLQSRESSFMNEGNPHDTTEVTGIV